MRFFGRYESHEGEWIEHPRGRTSTHAITFLDVLYRCNGCGAEEWADLALGKWHVVSDDEHRCVACSRGRVRLWLDAEELTSPRPSPRRP